MRCVAAFLILFACAGLANANALNFREFSDQALALLREGKAAEAEAVAREALAVAEGNSNPRVSTDRLRGVALSRLGTALRLQGRNVEAENVLREALSKTERELGNNHTLTVSNLLQLGMSLLIQGRYKEADAVLRDAVNRSDAVYGESSSPPEWFRAWSRSWLCNLDQLVGRYEEAEALCNESIRIAGDNPRLLRWRQNSEHNLTRMWLRRGQPDRAEAPARRAAELASAAWGPNHSNTGDAYSQLAKVLMRQGQLEAAEAWLDKAVPIVRNRLGKEHGAAVRVFTEMGDLLERKGDLAGAESLYREALQKGGDGTSRATKVFLLRKLATLLSNAEREAEAAPFFREAMDLSDRMFAQTRHQENTSRERVIEQIRPIYNLAVRNLVHLHSKSPREGADREALAVISRTQSRIFSEMLRQTRVAQQADNPELGALRSALALAMQDEAQRLSQLATLASLNPASGKYAPVNPSDDALVQRRMVEQIDKLADELAQARTLRAEAEQTLWAKFPSFMELTDPRPVTVEALQKKLLKPDETLLSYYLLPKAVAIFRVTRDAFELKMVKHSEGEIAARVKAVRKPAEDGGVGAGALRQLHPEDLNALYNLLLKPVESRIPANSKVLIVADGALYTLPFEMLVSRWEDADRQAFDVAARKGDLSEYAALPYTGKRHHFSYLPSLAALAYQRGQAHVPKARPANAGDNAFGFGAEAAASAPDLAFMAFADPVFEAPSRTMSGATRSLLERVGSQRGGRLNIPRLAETADEARAIAALLGGRSRLYLREDAQEARAKKAELRGVRYLHFATHGLLGQESTLLQSFKGEQASEGQNGARLQRNLVIDEDTEALAAPSEPNASAEHETRPGQPALLMTLVGDLDGEDGLLTMSEVIDSLKLDADLVVLSACNTAGERDNTRNGEGFAGLTRAFMHAGAKGLLVSHWSVESQATRDLMVEFFRRLKTSQSASIALSDAQAAIRSSRDPGSHLSRAHPFFWAPFVHVGD